MPRVEFHGYNYVCYLKANTQMQIQFDGGSYYTHGECIIRVREQTKGDNYSKNIVCELNMSFTSEYAVHM